MDFCVSWDCPVRFRGTKVPFGYCPEIFGNIGAATGRLLASSSDWAPKSVGALRTDFAIAPKCADAPMWPAWSAAVANGRYFDTDNISLIGCNRMAIAPKCAGRMAVFKNSQFFQIPDFHLCYVEDVEWRFPNFTGYLIKTRKIGRNEIKLNQFWEVKPFSST